MNRKVKEFWNNLGITGENFLLVMRRLNKPDVKEFNNKEKIKLVQNIYQNKVNYDKNIILEEQKKLNNLKLKLNMENSKLLRRKNEEKFFRNEDNIQKYEELSYPIQSKINKHFKILKNNQIILNKLNHFLTS
jgi:hypothetical protein